MSLFLLCGIFRRWETRWRFWPIAIGLLVWAACPGEARAQELRIAYTNTHRDFGRQLELAAERCGLKAIVEFIDTEQLTQAVLRRTSVDRCPDAVVMAADNLAKEILAFSPIPVIGGNHLVLYYNKALVSPPPGDLTRFATPDDGRRSVVWNHSSMYYFWPFVLGQDGNPLQLNRMQIRNPGLAQALTEYVSEGKRLQLMEGAEGGNSFDSFVAGRAQSLIDGDWSLGALEERLGDDLGITELPKMNGVPLRSPCSAFVLAFPAQSLQGEKQVALKRLAEQLQSVEFQTAIWKTMRALPVNEQLIEAIRSSDDELLRGSLERFLAAEPLANDARMQIVWEALKRGYDRYSAGFYDAAETTAYMQHLVEKSLRNPATPTP